MYIFECRCRFPYTTVTTAEERINCMYWLNADEVVTVCVRLVHIYRCVDVLEWKQEKNWCVY